MKTGGSKCSTATMAVHRVSDGHLGGESGLMGAPSPLRFHLINF